MLMSETSLDEHLCTVLLQKGNGMKSDFVIIFYWIISQQRGNKGNFQIIFSTFLFQLWEIRLSYWSGDLSLLHSPK